MPVPMVAVSIPSGISFELLTKSAFEASTTTHIKKMPITTIAIAPRVLILATIGVFLLRTFAPPVPDIRSIGNRYIDFNINEQKISHPLKNREK